MSRQWLRRQAQSPWEEGLGEGLIGVVRRHRRGWVPHAPRVAIDRNPLDHLSWNESSGVENSIRQPSPPTSPLPSMGRG